MARFMKPIGIERPQDLAKPGIGQITVTGSRVQGRESKFTEAFPTQPGLIFVARQTLSVAKVISDTELLLKAAAYTNVTEWSSYKLAPKVDHSTEFENVYKQLRSGGCVGIFPEVWQ